jgi:hypothetical protein
MQRMREDVSPQVYSRATALYLVLQFLDCLTTTQALYNGGSEANPTASWLVNAHPWATFPAKAIVLVPVIILWLWLRERWPVGAKALLVFGILAGVYAVVNNILASGIIVF